MLGASRYRGGGVGDLKGRGLEIGHSYDSAHGYRKSRGSIHLVCQLFIYVPMV